MSLEIASHKTVMALSATPEGELKVAETEEGSTPNAQNGEYKQANATQSNHRGGQRNKPKVQSKPQGPHSSADSLKDGAPSKKELKDQAKAQKKAKREKAKQDRQGQPVVGMKGGSEELKINSEAPQTPGSAAQAIKTHQRRRSSAGAHTQKPLPLRPAESQAARKPLEIQAEPKKVALFEHLYGHARRTTIAGASKDIHPSVLALGLQISNYEICGSNVRCVATLLVFKQVITSYTTPVGTSLPRHLTTHLSSQIDYLVSCRPLSVSQGNAIRWLKVMISAVDVTTPEHQAKTDLCLAIDNFINERINVADQVISASGAERIRNGDVVLTYAKSSVVEKTLREAFHQGKRFRVIVVDSRPLFEGRNLARALATLGIEVEYSLTHGINHIIPSVTKAILGAHAMMSNGRLYSRIGTAIVAMVAKDAKIPVIVCCESVKLTDRVALDSFVHNEIAPEDELLIPGPGTDEGQSASPLEKWRDVPNLQMLNLMYDLTPAEYIDMVITEYGSLPPSSVMAVQRLSTNT